MVDERKRPDSRLAEARAEAAQAQSDALAEELAARFDADSMIGHSVEEATSYYREQGFPEVMVEQEGGGSVLSYMATRVRLTVDNDGIVVGAHLG